MKSKCTRRSVLGAVFTSFGITSGCVSNIADESEDTGNTKQSTKTQEQTEKSIFLNNYSGEELSGKLIAFSLLPQENTTIQKTTSDETSSAGERIFETEFKVNASEREEFSSVFPVIDETKTYRVYVRLANGTSASFSFTNRPEDKFRFLSITIQSSGTIEFAKVVT